MAIAILKSMTKRTNTRRDFTQIAFNIVQQATGEAEPTPELTGKKGGKTMAEKLTPKQRSEIAKKAAQARWKE